MKIGEWLTCGTNGHVFYVERDEIENGKVSTIKGGGGDWESTKRLLKVLIPTHGSKNIRVTMDIPFEGIDLE